MTKYLAFALLLLATPASAGSISITITNDAGAAVGTKTFTVSTAHLLRLIAAMKIVYGQPGMTNSETLNAWLNDVMVTAMNRTRNVEGAAAVDAIAPINIQ